jgi:hypothetical protein
VWLLTASCFQMNNPRLEPWCRDASGAHVDFEGEGSVVIRTRAQWRRLARSGVTEIQGHLAVIGTDLVDLGDGVALTHVDGNLCIKDNALLTGLEGLNALSSVGGTVQIENNDALSNLAGLSSLTSIGGDLNIHGPVTSSRDVLSGFHWVYTIGNAELTSLEGLDALTSIGGSVRIGHNAALRALRPGSWPRALEHDLLVVSNPSLTSLEGLDDLISVDGTLRIASNPSLAVFSFPGLVSVGRFEIVANPALDTLTGLESLESVTQMRVSGNSSLIDLVGLSALGELGDLIVNGNANLERLTGLEALTVAHGDLFIGSNESLVDLQGLEALTTIGGSLRIGGTFFDGRWVQGDLHQSMLRNVEGLSGLTRIGGDLSLSFNDGLVDLSGLDRLESAGGVEVVGNPSLIDVRGLEQLTEIQGHLRILRNDALVDLSGLDNLGRVTGNVVIEGRRQDLVAGAHDRGHPALTHLTGLESLTTIDGRLFVVRNDVLASLEGLSALIRAGNMVEIRDNPDLPDCEVAALRERLEASGWEGVFQSEGNLASGSCP